MQQKYLLIFSICLIGLCVSQQTRQQNKSKLNEYEKYKQIDTIEQPDQEVGDLIKEDVENLIAQNENNEQQEKDKSTNEWIDKYSKTENGESGKCFAKMISDCRQSKKLCIEYLLDQMTCIANQCQLQIPQAQDYKDCVVQQCLSHQQVVRQHNFQLYTCLKNLEQQNNDQQEILNNQNNNYEKMFTDEVESEQQNQTEDNEDEDEEDDSEEEEEDEEEVDKKEEDQSEKQEEDQNQKEEDQQSQKEEKDQNENEEEEGEQENEERQENEKEKEEEEQENEERQENEKEKEEVKQSDQKDKDQNEQEDENKEERQENENEIDYGNKEEDTDIYDSDNDNLIEESEEKYQEDIENLIDDYSKAENGENGICYAKMVSDCSFQSTRCKETLIVQTQCIAKTCLLQVLEAEQFKTCIENQCKTELGELQQFNQEAYVCLQQAQEQQNNNNQKIGQHEINQDENDNSSVNQDRKTDSISSAQHLPLILFLVFSILLI